MGDSLKNKTVTGLALLGAPCGSILDRVTSGAVGIVLCVRTV